MASLWSVLFQLNVVLLVVLLIAMAFVERGSGAFVIGVVTGGVIGLSLLGTGLFIYFDIDPLESIE